MFNKFFFSCYFGFCVLMLSGCQPSASNSVNNDLIGKNEMPANTQTEQQELPLPNLNVTTNSNKMIVMLGGVSIKDGQLVAEGFVDGEENRETVKPGMIFDVMNCAGYIGQIRILPQPNDGFEPYWQNVEWVADSIRSNFEEAIKKCSSNKEFLNASSAFAVYPSIPKRQNIKIQNQPTTKDLKQIYNSFTPEQKKWRATRNKERDPKFYEMLENDYDWADSDGDGKIDLITINGTCSGIPNDELSCVKILHLVNSEWKEVARITPA